MHSVPGYDTADPCNFRPGRHARLGARGPLANKRACLFATLLRLLSSNIVGVHQVNHHHHQMSASSVHADAPPEVVVDPEGLQYETGPQLGKGGFAICHRAKLLGHEHLGNNTVALKIVKSKMEPPKLAQKVG